jgi:hypothetical protein
MYSKIKETATVVDKHDDDDDDDNDPRLSLGLSETPLKYVEVIKIKRIFNICTR